MKKILYIFLIHNINQKGSLKMSTLHILYDGTLVQISHGYSAEDIDQYYRIGDCNRRFCWCIQNGLDPFETETMYNRALMRAKKHVESGSSYQCQVSLRHIKDHHPWQEWDDKFM